MTDRLYAVFDSVADTISMQQAPNKPFYLLSLGNLNENLTLQWVIPTFKMCDVASAYGMSVGHMNNGVFTGD